MILIYIIKKRKNLITTIIVIFLVCLFTNGIYKLICEKNNIKYSIENNCWSIENDIAIDKIIKKNTKVFSGNFSFDYYVVTEKYGKIFISHFMYDNLKKNDDIYVLCVQNKSGKKYAIANGVWPADKTFFIEELPYKK